jgi:putative transposase
VPQAEDGLARAIGEAHRRYTRRINFREKWRGYLWQGRFASFVMDEPYLLAAARYVELNPVRAGLVADAADWRGFLNSAIREEELRDLREHGRTGFPPGNATFVERVEQTVGRALRAGKPGRPRKLLKRA